MRKNSAVWVLCNCVSRDQARKIGEAVLNERLAVCFDIYSRKFSSYFWPPKSDKREEAKGSLLILTTLEKNYEKITGLIEEAHSDQIPFVAYLPIQGVGDAYFDWLKNEIS